MLGYDTFYLEILELIFWLTTARPSYQDCRCSYEEGHLSKTFCVHGCTPTRHAMNTLTIEQRPEAVW